MMASIISTGSPRVQRKPSAHFTVLDQNSDPRSNNSAAQSASNSPAPLQTSKFSNLQPIVDEKASQVSNSGKSSPMDGILARLRANENQNGAGRVVSNPGLAQAFPQHPNDQHGLKKQNSDLGRRIQPASAMKQDPKDSSSSDIATPMTDVHEATFGMAKLSIGDMRNDAVEMLRVRQELAAAKSVINRQEKELAESRTIQHTMDKSMGPNSDADFSARRDVTDSSIGHMQSAFNATARPFTARNNTWMATEETRSDNTDSFSIGSYDRPRPMMNNTGQLGFQGMNPAIPQATSIADLPYGQQHNAPWSSSLPSQGILPQTTLPPAQRLFSGPTLPSMGIDGRFGADPTSYGQGNGYRRVISGYSRPPAGFNGRGNAFGNAPDSLNNILPQSISPPPYATSLGYSQRPHDGDISPTASHFNMGPMTTLGSTPWTPMTNATGQTYVTPLEPLNYRRLLDKSVSCDWKYIVDKIVCNNDQQASIFLQQKLKVGTAEQKFEIVEAIINQAYPLMINRFGNFLVQRCFEHGTPDQVVAIANSIHGNVISLSMDAFGCHVIQKAFDSVPENHKADMVRELLRRIPDTVIHRYACHVWQKLFELRWTGEPPQIMSKVNDALRGMWHEVALGETGSLVVQNIFENCVEEEKRPAIEEVIASIDLIAHGQFGNWCIQHLCEHAAPADKRRVIDHILANAYSYSIDQFASKVVEKCLKIGGTEFLDRYLGVITAAHPDRPRIPLIDIAGDQYGNYLIQWILMNSQYHQREQVAIHIRKHMVSLRGSKFGSRVAMLCCNPAQVTRPGPGVIVNPFGAPGQPRGWGRFR